MFKTPILFLIFNRPDTTKEVFKTIRAIKPAQLFIAADGARINKEGEIEKCEETKKYVLNNIDWDCEVKTLFREQNLGCARGVSEAITWFFEHVEQGIILEDDCVPSLSFYKYCEELLDLYKDDQQIWEISGNNFQDGIQRGNGSYYFSYYGSIWGWATWRRAWKHYDLNINEYSEFIRENKMGLITTDKIQKEYWERVFSNVKISLNTWDYQWVFTMWNNKGLSAVPNVNLVENIGFSSSATHTLEKPSWYDERSSKAREIDNIEHPIEITNCKEAGDYIFYKAFYNPKISLFMRIRNKIKRISNMAFSV